MRCRQDDVEQRCCQRPPASSRTRCPGSGIHPLHSVSLRRLRGAPPEGLRRWRAPGTAGGRGAAAGSPRARAARPRSRVQLWVAASDHLGGSLLHLDVGWDAHVLDDEPFLGPDREVAPASASSRIRFSISACIHEASIAWHRRDRARLRGGAGTLTGSRHRPSGCRRVSRGRWHTTSTPGNRVSRHRSAGGPRRGSPAG
jgi:hypothetical protein